MLHYVIHCHERREPRWVRSGDGRNRAELGQDGLIQSGRRSGFAPFWVPLRCARLRFIHCDYCEECYRSEKGRSLYSGDELFTGRSPTVFTHPTHKKTATPFRSSPTCLLLPLDRDHTPLYLFQCTMYRYVSEPKLRLYKTNNLDRVFIFMLLQWTLELNKLVLTLFTLKEICTHRLNYTIIVNNNVGQLTENISISFVMTNKFLMFSWDSTSQVEIFLSYSRVSLQ